MRSMGVGAAVSTYRSFDELEQLHGAWQALQGDHVLADPDFFAATISTDDDALRPHVIAVGDDAPSLIGVGRLEEISLPCRLGYVTLYKPRVRSLTIVPGGLIGDVTEEAAAAVLDSLETSLGSGEADVALVRHVELDSPLYRLATTRPGFFSRQHVVTSGVHWELTLPDSFDAYVASRSKKTRKMIRSHRRRVARDFEGRVSVRRYTRPEELDELVAQIAPVAERTYQHALGAAFEDTPKFRAQTTLAMERGWFRAWVLSIDGRPCAFRWGEAYGGRFRSVRPGYDPAYRQYGVGTWILLHVIEDLCQDPDVQVFDFGLGDSEAKRRFGDRSWVEGDAIVYAPTLRSASINVIRSALLRTSGATRAAASRVHALDPVKRRWRRRLSADGARSAT